MFAQQLDDARRMQQMGNLASGGSAPRALTVEVIDAKLERIAIELTSLQTDRDKLSELRLLIAENPKLARLVELGQKLGML